ncbi:MAG TPA: hypothetical protein VEZ71_23370, partial [Archangium sp.]|nr:hypothetical protein [Archangium sp.]
RGGMEIDKLNVSLFNASFAECEHAFLDYERKRLQSARGEGERREVKRRVAECILADGFARRCSWAEFNRALQRIKRLGYSDVGKRVEVAAHFALSTGRFPDQAGKARAMLDEAERRLRFVNKRHYLRKEWMEEIRRIRRMTGWEGLATTSRKKRKSTRKR